MKDNNRNSKSMASKASEESCVRSKDFRSKGKNRSTHKSKKENRVGTNYHTTSLNDVSWYSRNPELLAAVSRVPFPYKPGMTVQLSDDPIQTSIVPGVCAIDFAYSVGYSEDVNSPASIAAREMYARIRSKFSGSLEADAPDIFMYCLALDSIHAYIAWMKRVYKVINLYTPNNRNYPDLILSVMGFPETEILKLKTNTTKLWGIINTLVRMANKFRVPDDMDIYHRHRWMNENIYLDDPQPEAQSYIFCPKFFWEVVSQSSTGTALHAAEHMDIILSNGDPVDGMFEFGDNLIAKLSQWGDSYKIDGYMKRAYEDTQWLTSELQAENELLIPVYEPEVLSQIENARPIGGFDPEVWGVQQRPETNAILHEPTASRPVDSTSNSRPATGITWLNMPSVAPTGAEIAVATRLLSFVDDYESRKIMCGTEAVTGIRYRIGFGTTEGAGIENPIMTADLNTIDNTMVHGMRTILAMSLTSEFNHAPNFLLEVRNDDIWVASYIQGNFKNVTGVSCNILKELNRVCVYSEFNAFRDQ